jgi:hypothetical protein
MNRTSISVNPAGAQEAILQKRENAAWKMMAFQSLFP